MFNPEFSDPDYQEQLAMVRDGDTVRIQDKTFRLVAYLGEGGVSKVFDRGDGTVIRIPKSINPAILQWNREYLDSYFLLKDTGIHMPRVHADISHPPYYVIVDKVDVKFNMLKFFRGQVGVDADTRARIRAAFIKVAEQTAKYSFIPDIKAANWVWDGERLILIDRLSVGLRKATKISDPVAFEFMKDLPADLRAEMIAAVMRARQAMPCFITLAP